MSGGGGIPSRFSWAGSTGSPGGGAKTGSGGFGHGAQPVGHRVGGRGPEAEDAGAHLYDPDAKDPPNRVGFTTSPAAYDHDCTVELERFTCAIYPHDKPREFRKVLVRGGTGFSIGQMRRYFDFTDEDPRVVRDRFAAECAERAARKAAEASVAAADEAFLALLTLPELEAEHKARGDVDLWTNEAEARRARSSKALPLRRQEVLDAAWENFKVTYDPIASSLKKSADDAFALGFLHLVPRYDCVVFPLVAGAAFWLLARVEPVARVGLHHVDVFRCECRLDSVIPPRGECTGWKIRLESCVG